MGDMRFLHESYNISLDYQLKIKRETNLATFLFTKFYLLSKVNICYSSDCPHNRYCICIV